MHKGLCCVTAAACVAMGGAFLAKGRMTSESTPRLVTRPDGGLAWLAAVQNPDGSFGDGSTYPKLLTTSIVIGFVSRTSESPVRNSVLASAAQYLIRSQRETGDFEVDHRIHPRELTAMCVLALKTLKRIDTPQGLGSDPIIEPACIEYLDPTVAQALRGIMESDPIGVPELRSRLSIDGSWPRGGLDERIIFTAAVVRILSLTQGAGLP